MAKNWAITIGVNKYDYLQHLNYAKQDAQLMHDFLGKEASFEQVYFFTDDSPDIAGKSTRPNRANLRHFLLTRFEKPFMEPGDNFWFFFSGHGMRHADRDYLMPSDGNPEDVVDTAIPINFISERLRRCGADNVVLILDACRNQGTRGEGLGRQTAEEARQTGVISIFSCSPNEYSYEIEALQQGAFTSALLEGLGMQGRCATVERLNQYLSFRVPEIARQHNKARQTPYIIAEPVTKSHLILVPKYATLADISTLKNDAFEAEVEQNIDLAEQLWIRVLVASSGTDTKAIQAIQRIAINRNLPNIHEQKEHSNIQQEKITQESKDDEDILDELTDESDEYEVNNNRIPDQSIDYKQLRELLESGKWKEADKETKHILLRLANREIQTYLSFESAYNLSNQDIYQIDKLWQHYSSGHFGFSIQKQIWQGLGYDIGKYDEEAWFKFGEIVGWRSQRKHQILFANWTTREWSYYSDIKFSLDSPKGHLPRLWDEWRGGIELSVIFSKI
ncbi:GUN4 domain-containing protein [Calothrix sp. PCC 6303]|uniref:GUN4 domain-containing protein n=1 Tax=Calothrix sp. PCC 6303 TaxID=1170562 RepID=UPI0002A02B62|nr:GUN4 domain-containing protein [Calothrix sp. PCC 6303]AFZ02731.1 GUN4 domain protein [Calothrix sp. PCC 6303]